jgi:hypothetical protein
MILLGRNSDRTSKRREHVCFALMLARYLCWRAGLASSPVMVLGLLYLGQDSRKSARSGLHDVEDHPYYPLSVSRRLPRSPDKQKADRICPYSRTCIREWRGRCVCKVTVRAGLRGVADRLLGVACVLLQRQALFNAEHGTPAS